MKDIGLLLMCCSTPCFVYAQPLATAQGTASVTLIYKEGYEVGKASLNGKNSNWSASSVSIDGTPSTDISLDWSESTIVENIKTGEEVVIEFEKPQSARSHIGNNAKFDTKIMPKDIHTENLQGDFKGSYNINLTY